MQWPPKNSLLQVNLVSQVYPVILGLGIIADLRNVTPSLVFYRPPWLSNISLPAESFPLAFKYLLKRKYFLVLTSLDSSSHCPITFFTANLKEIFTSTSQFSHLPLTLQPTSLTSSSITPLKYAGKGH